MQLIFLGKENFGSGILPNKQYVHRMEEECAEISSNKKANNITDVIYSLKFSRQHLADNYRVIPSNSSSCFAIRGTVKE